MSFGVRLVAPGGMQERLSEAALVQVCFHLGWTSWTSADAKHAVCKSAEGGANAEDRAVELTEHGFEPFVDSGGVIRLRNCPYHDLARENTDLIVLLTWP